MLKDLKDKLKCPICGAKPDKVHTIDEDEINPRFIFRCPTNWRKCQVEDVTVEF